MTIRVELTHEVNPEDPPVLIELFVDGEAVGKTELSPPDDLSSWDGRHGQVTIQFPPVTEEEHLLGLQTTLRSGEVKEAEHLLIEREGEWVTQWTAPGPEPPESPESSQQE